jgi:hypothetical protein
MSVRWRIRFLRLRFDIVGTDAEEVAVRERGRPPIARRKGFLPDGPERGEPGKTNPVKGEWYSHTILLTRTIRKKADTFKVVFPDVEVLEVLAPEEVAPPPNCKKSCCSVL